VAPGGHVVETDADGVLRFVIDPATVAGGALPTKAGFVYTGGAGATATITITPGTGAPVDEVQVLAANDPNDPSDNVFVGVEWSDGIAEVQVAVDPASAASQFDHIQFDVAPSVCAESPSRSSDFNGDRWSDLVVQNLQTGEIAVQLMLDGEGAGLGPVGQPRDSNWTIQSIGSWGGEAPVGGVAGALSYGPSIAWRNLSNGTLFGWRLDGTGFANEYQILPTVWIGWDLIGSGDLNGDGIADFVWRNEEDGRIGYWVMKSDGQPEDWFTFEDQASIVWDLVGVGDFNGDGRSDLLWLNLADLQMGVWYLDGNFRIDAPIGLLTSTAPPMSRVAGVADYDNDGVADILWDRGGPAEIWYLEVDTAAGEMSSGRDLSVRETVTPILDVGDGWRIRGGG